MSGNSKLSARRQNENTLVVKKITGVDKAYTPQADSHPGQTPTSGCCGIWSTSGQYTSYWNAYLLPPANEVCEGYVLHVSVCPRGEGVCILACLAGHMTNQQYISSCTVAGSQFVWRQHTGSIQCMMG